MSVKQLKKKGKRTLLVDTSVLVAFLVKEDPHHKKAVEDLSQIDVLLVPVEVLVETALFFRKHGISFRILLEFLSSEDVEVVNTAEDDIIAALRATEGSQKYFVDYVIYNASVRLGVPFLTYDDNFRKKFFA